MIVLRFIPIKLIVVLIKLIIIGGIFGGEKRNELIENLDQNQSTMNNAFFLASHKLLSVTYY